MTGTKIDSKDQPLFDTIKRLPEEKRLMVLVADVPFSTRVARCLRAGNIRTLGDLTFKTEGDLLRIRSFGRDSLNEVRAYMAEVGLGVGTRKKSIPTIQDTLVQSTGPTQVVTYSQNTTPLPGTIPSVWFVGPPRGGTISSSGNVTVPAAKPGEQMPLQFKSETREQAELKKLLADMKRMIVRIEEVLS